MGKIVRADGLALQLHSITMKFPPDQYKFLQEQKKKTGVTLSQQVRILVAREMNLFEGK